MSFQDHISLTAKPLDEQEQREFEPDLKDLGLDSFIWNILNGTLSRNSHLTQIKVLRLYRNKLLCGVAFIAVCKQYGGCLFENVVLSNVIDQTKIPLFLWMKGPAGVDTINNPGFVANGLKREDFLHLALKFLKRKFLYGFLIGEKNEESYPGAIVKDFADFGVLDLTQMKDLDSYLDSFQNVRKKLRKFSNKGGTVKVKTGALDEDQQSALLNIYDTIKPLILTPFQDNYKNMVQKTFSDGTGKIIHFLTFLNDQVVGYHSFARMQNSLYCLSGAFDRSSLSTFHAYENLIVESAKYGFENQISSIYYGPVLNPTKARMLNHFQPMEQRVFTGFGVLNKLFPLILKKSKLNPSNFKDFVQIET